MDRAGQEATAAVVANDICISSMPRKVSPGRLHHLLELAFHAVPALQGGIGLLSSDGELLEHITYGLSEPSAHELEQSAGLATLLQMVARLPAPTRLRSLTTAGLPADMPLPQGPFLGLPLTCTGRNRGVLYLIRALNEPAFNDREEDLLLPLGSWLEQANLSEEARLLNRLRLLNAVAQAAAGDLRLTSILEITLRELDRLLPLHICAVWLAEEGIGSQLSGGTKEPAADAAPPTRDPKSLSPELLLAASSPASADMAAALGLLGGRRLPLEQVPFASCLSDGQALYADHWPAARGQEIRNPKSEIRNPECAPSSDFGFRISDLASPTPDPWPLTPYFAVPLRAGDRCVGVLQSVCTRPAGFTGEQIQLLYLVADLLGPAISNCRLFGDLSEAYEELRVTQGQLIQAEKMRALGELAGGVAHEFNNSLCGVLGFLELALLNKSLDPACRGFLESARTCASDAAQTVRRVQDFARWRRNDNNGQLLDLNAVVRQTADLIRHKWEGFAHSQGQGIRLEVITGAAVPIAAIPSELREVITNLAFNAVDAMPSGGTLTLRTWNTKTDVFLAVSDTGVGIAESVRHRLFEPFFTTKGERGSGLGLSVAFGIVRRHGGEITVESREGAGSTFTVRLPRASGDASPIAAPPPSAAPALRSLRILVVEDEESVRRFLDNGLNRLGHRPRLVGNVPEGLAALGEETFDVVLTDLGLPGPNGEEMARRVAERSPPTPVVLLTGWADQLHADKRSIPGVSRILAKPVTLDTLAAALAGVVPA
jgi:signal transduction histidine kinase/CheY-like chemotaxis protein